MALSHRIIFVYHKSKNMSVIVLLIGVSVLVAGAFLGAFLWSVKNGQMDDDYTPSIRMLFDDETTSTKK
jgi:cbb3-type cytochrome oxidase maturation protein